MEKLFEAAANWWAEQISGHKLNWDNGAQNEGDAKDREAGNMMWLLGNYTAMMARDRNTPEKNRKIQRISYSKDEGSIRKCCKTLQRLSIGSFRRLSPR